MRVITVPAVQRSYLTVHWSTVQRSDPKCCPRILNSTMSDNKPTGRHLPTETEFHKGLDGAIIGLTLVFIAKLPILSLLNFRITWIRLANKIHLGLTHWNSSIEFLTVTGLTTRSPGTPSIVFTFIPYLVTRISTAPFRLFGKPDFVLDLALVWIGGWIAILYPLWHWVMIPVGVWIQEIRPFRRAAVYLVTHVLRWL